MASAHDVAAFIVRWFNDGKEQEEVELTQLKLQKLLYYCQGYHLAMTGNPLFPEPIQAWTHGPVVAQVYDSYLEKNKGGVYNIFEPVAGCENALTPEQEDICDEVLSVRGQFSAWKLRDMTHEEWPWKEAYNRGNKSEVTQDSMREYFSEWIVKG